MPAFRPRANGFTLIEILLVVTVMGILAVMVLPNMGKAYGRVKLKVTAGDIAYLLRYAQSRAVITQHRFRLVFEGSPLEYRLEEEGTNLEYHRITGRFSRSFKVPERIKVDPDETVIGLTPDGGIAPATIRVCEEERCLLVLTRLQKGQVHVVEEGVEVTP